MTYSETLTTDVLVDEALALGEGLGRSLRYVQINSFYNGSTGAIMRNLHRGLTERGVDSYIFWGRRHETISDHEQCCATKLGVYSHGARTRLFGKAGFYSKSDTKRLLEKLDEIGPDIVHLHNIHGYYVNVEMLFSWLSAHEDVLVRWTLHDCWAFTGHCAHFSYVGCKKWQEGGCDASCPQLDTYPSTVSKASCAWNFENKRACFTQLPVERMKLITPSFWLAKLVGQSFLSKYPVEVRHNTVDTRVFQPTPGDFREKYGIGSRFMILGVASPWTERKGIGDFINLANHIDPLNYAIVLVGIGKKQAKSLPASIICLSRTESPQELARIYSTADVFLNPTREDNYPTVNLEAEACGTPVLTYDTGGCKEGLTLSNSKALAWKNCDELIRLIEDIKDRRCP